MARKPREEPYHHGDLRQTLIDAAIDLLENGGVEPLTLRGVARRAGVSEAAPYHHFRDKGALLAAVAEEGFKALAGFMGIAAKKARSPRDRLEAMSRAYVKFSLTHRAYFLVMFGPHLDRHWKESPLREAAMAGIEQLVEAVKAVLPPRSHLDPTDAAILGWAAVHGLVSLWIGGPIARVALGRRDLSELTEVIAHLSARALMD
jgi:AcrR family transcriptional regulator